MPKLRDQAAKEAGIRARWAEGGTSQPALAKEFGVSERFVGKCVRGIPKGGAKGAPRAEVTPDPKGQGEDLQVREPEPPAPGQAAPPPPPAPRPLARVVRL